MNKKRSISCSEEDDSDLKKYKNKFTEVESVFSDDVGDKYFDETLSDEYEPQFFNFQLIGDLVAVEILNSKDLIIKRPYYVPVEPFTHQKFCNADWSVHDLLHEMKFSKSRCPIAKKVILSVGYNDCRTNSMNAAMFVEGLEKTIEKLRRRGCKELILTNVPPCGILCDSINHWKYLQIINDEIFKLSEKHDYIDHCDIFKLFCKPRNFFCKNNDYVVCSEINYKLDFTMYNEVGCDGEIDLIRFSNLAKIVLGKYVAEAVKKRLEYLRHGPVDKVICVLKEASDVDSDSEDDVLLVKITNKGECAEPINLDSSDEDDVVVIKNEIPEKNRKLMSDILSNIINIDDINDEKPSCKMSQTDEPKHIFSTSVGNVGVLKDEKLACEMPQKEVQITQEISSNIEKFDNIENEKPSCEIPSGDGQFMRVISCNFKKSDYDDKKLLYPPLLYGLPSQGLDAIKDEKPSSKIHTEDSPFKQVILYRIKDEP